ncbi:AraC family transcriptional regulator [Spirosoma flavum]|uniref:AraC family transcriptional regulator n=1 Tax=Spirosoma flavum TaxID=2048557 RepID=A0ABW6AJR7_9BACT
MSPLTRKSRGFAGERIIEIPKETVDKCLSMPLISSLFITRMGFYPKALYHYYQRPTGISQVILLYCTDGQGWLQLGKVRLAIQAGEVFAIAPGTPHSYGADAENPWTIHWFHFSGTLCHESISAIMNEPSGGTQAIRVPYSEERIALFDRMFDTFLKGYSTSNLLFANLTLPFFLASFILPENFQKEIVASGTTTPTNKAILYMQANLTKAITLDNIAQSINLSTSFFSRRFKQDTGYAPIEYFNHLRIQKACQLLHFSDLRINEVASQLGIDDPFYFSRLFKKQMGVSPADYRKSEGIQRRI